MGTRVRKQVYLDERQNAEVKRRAKEQGISESEVIRQAIEKLLEAGPQGGTDPSALDKVLEFARARMAKGPLPGGRTWTRDDAYEDRMSRYGPPVSD